MIGEEYTFNKTHIIHRILLKLMFGCTGGILYHSSMLLRTDNLSRMCLFELLATNVVMIGDLKVWPSTKTVTA